MSDTYRGDTWPKKLARAIFWGRMSCEVINGSILCLASRDGGDISTLKGIGVAPSSIVAVEIDPEAASSAQRKHPDVRVICDDVANVAKKWGKRFGLALLDFCAPPSDSIAKTVASVAESMAHNGWMGVAVLVGRDQGTARTYTNKDRIAEMERHALARMRQRLPGGIDLSRDKEVIETAEWRDAWNRGATLARMVSERTAEVDLFGFWSIRYRSVGIDSLGSCMHMEAFKIHRLSRFFKKRSLLESRKAFLEESRSWFMAEVIEAVKNKGMAVFDEDEPPSSDVIIPTDINACKRECVRYASLFAFHDPAMVLNLSKQEWAALQAHATRGSYSRNTRKGAVRWTR